MGCANGQHSRQRQSGPWQVVATKWCLVARCKTPLKVPQVLTSAIEDRAGVREALAAACGMRPRSSSMGSTL